MKTKNKLVLAIIIITIIFINKVDLRGKLNYNNESYTQEEKISDENSNLLLVNKSNPISEDYKPNKLVKPKVPFLKDTKDESRYMDEVSVNALEELFKCAKKEGIILIGSSAYRSYESQVKIYNKNVLEKGIDYANKYVAIPGKSEHQTGLSIDVTNKSRCFDKTSIEAKWLANNAHRFGFILRYPEGKEDITGYNYEPWHIRYVGKEPALKIFTDNITLEEYMRMI